MESVELKIYEEIYDIDKNSIIGGVGYKKPAALNYVIILNSKGF